jgi:hypothetical protein
VLPEPEAVSLREDGGQAAFAYVIATVMVVGMAAAVIFNYVMGVYLHRAYPYTTFLFKPEDHFRDFYNVYRDARRFKPGVSDNMVYSPVLHLFTDGLTLVPATVAFVLVVTSFLVSLLAVLWSWLTRPVRSTVARLQLVAVFALLSYPVLFAVDRGNLEMVVFVLLALFFWLHYGRRSRLAWLPLSLAIAAKYYWATLLVVFLCDRSYRQALYAAVAAVAETLVSVLLLSWISGYSVVRVLHALVQTLNGHVEGTNTLFFAQHGHSLWGVVTVFDRWTNGSLQMMNMQRVRELYMLLSLAVFAAVARQLLRHRHDPWQVATVLVACALLLPFEDHDYTLIHLYLPLSLFMLTVRRGRLPWACALAFAVCLIPWAYHDFTFRRWLWDVSTSVLVYPAALVALIVLPLLVGPAPAQAGAGAGLGLGSDAVPRSGVGADGGGAASAGGDR